MENVAQSELVGGTEDCAGLAFEVNDGALGETLGTGLFTSRGVDRMGWAHQSYAEFLAARYIVSHKFKLPQVLSLVSRATPEGSKVVPQMREVCGWLAMKRADFVKVVGASDSELAAR